MTVQKANFDKKGEKISDPKKPEIFIALISPIGTDLQKVYTHLATSLGKVGYKAHHIKLSSLLKADKENKEESEFERIKRLMRAGNALREKMKDGSAVAQLAINKIASIRQEISGTSNIPVGGNAYILDSLKHDKEVEFLRNTYGQSIWIISVYEPYETRLEFLMDRNKKITREEIPLSETSTEKQASEKEAEEILTLDKGNGDSAFGQNVGKAFHLADVFISKKNKERTGFDLESQVDRFISLLFGAPFITPTKDEYGSFYAHAAALRSADL